MEILLLIWAGLSGLAIGSFLNVVIHRVPRNIKFINSRSKCPCCSEQLRWYHNIPVISYIFLRGRCAFCLKKISIRYPMVEIINALFFLYFFWQFGLSTNFFIFAAISSSLIAIFFIDMDFQIIPDIITIPGMIAGLAVSFLPDSTGFLNSLIGLLVGGGSLFLIANLGEWLFKKESMGGGDIKMAAMLGAFLGWQKIVLVFISSAFMGLIVSGTIMIFSKKLRQNRVIPFGPFLAMAAIISICYGEEIINYYLRNFVYLP